MTWLQRQRLSYEIPISNKRRKIEKQIVSLTKQIIEKQSLSLTKQNFRENQNQLIECTA